MAIVAVAGVTLAATTLLGVTFQGEKAGSGSAQLGSGSQEVGSLLATANRDRLAICVDAPGGSPELVAQARSEIEAVYTDIANEPYWERVGLTDAVREPVVDAGCPSEPFLLQLGVVSEDGRTIKSAPRNSEASIYRVFVFVLPSEQIERLPVGRRKGLAPQESIGERHVWHQVTTGLYLTADQVRDSTYLTDALKRAIGLREPY